MSRSTFRYRLFVFVALLAAVGLFAHPASAASPKESLPKLSRIEQSVRQHFASLAGDEPLGVVTRGDAEPLLNDPKLMGWLKSDRDAILKQLLGDDEFLAKELRTPAGRKFAAQIAKYPGGYDRLERLSRLPHGQRTIRDLIRGPGGEKLIQYMTDSPGGAEMGKMLSKTAKGRHFNQPTGRIYTVDMLLARLREAYQKAKQSQK